MTEQQPDGRLDAILEMLESIASLDFSSRLEISDRADHIDAVAAGLNMLSEELEASVVERWRLEEINTNLERFAGVAAHDMKSPLGESVALTILLEDALRDRPDERVSEYLELLRKASYRMSTMITGILEYSCISFANMQPQEVDLGKVCKDVAAQYASDERVAIRITDEMPLVVHYETALIQIMDNLLSNAVKHNDKDSCEIEIRCTEGTDDFEISVVDNGPGILPEDREKIFDMFENLASERRDSTGIGLATAKKVVTETNGRIWVEPTEDQGARVVFTIAKKPIQSVRSHGR